MSPAMIAECVARDLSKLWQFHRTQEFLNYVETTYQVTVSALPTFHRIYLAEADNGDIESGSIGGIINHWWVVDDDGFRTVKRPELPAEEATMFDSRPILKFYIENSR